MLSLLGAIVERDVRDAQLVALGHVAMRHEADSRALGAGDEHIRLARMVEHGGDAREQCGDARAVREGELKGVELGSAEQPAIAPERQEELQSLRVREARLRKGPEKLRVLFLGLRIRFGVQLGVAELERQPWLGQSARRLELREQRSEERRNQQWEFSVLLDFKCVQRGEINALEQLATACSVGVLARARAERRAWAWLKALDAVLLAGVTATALEHCRHWTAL